MNLAFLGYLSKEEVCLRHDQYHWPDGIWIKRHINMKKIPGREIIRNMSIPKNINKITVLGNFSEKSNNYLKRKFKLKIKNINLPFGNIDIIKRKKFH